MVIKLLILRTVTGYYIEERYLALLHKLKCVLTRGKCRLLTCRFDPFNGRKCKRTGKITNGRPSLKIRLSCALI